MELSAGSGSAANGDIASRKRHEPPGDDCAVPPSKRLNMGSTGVVQKPAAVGITAAAAAAPATTVATTASAAVAVSVSLPIQPQQQQPLQRTAQPETPTKTFSISSGGVKGLVLTTQSMLLSSPSKSGTILLNQPGGQRTPPAKIAVVPAKSPAHIAPASGGGSSSSSGGVVSSAASTLPTFTLSPPRVVIKNVGGVTALKSLPPGNSFQSVHVADLVTQPKMVVSAAAVAQSQPTLTVKTTSTKPITITGGRVVQSIVPSQRILLPATAGSTMIGMQSQQSAGIMHSQTISIITPSGGAAGGLGSGGGQMVAVLPADVVARLQSVSASQPATSIITTASAPLAMKKMDSFVPIASNDPSVGAGGAAARLSFANSSGASAGPSVGAAATSGTEPAPGRPRKPCNCTKSQCLKLYCDCFANGEFCHGCNCTNCANNLNHEEERQRAIKSCLDRNPQAFHPKIGVQPLSSGISGAIDVTRRHQKGCNCKRSGCLKNYCECYEAKIMCGSMCKCVGCKNFEESPERKTLMHLADAAEVRVQQQTAAKNKLSSQFRELESKACAPSSDRLAYSYVTYDVVEAICNCLLVQCQEAEQAKLKKAVVERLVIEEFGHSLLQIIQAANRPKD